MGRTEADHGMDEAECDVNNAYLLGGSGRTVLSLWNQEASASEENSWCV